MPQHDLAALGWNPELAEQLEPGLEPGRVIAAHRAAFDVQTATEAVRTRLPGRLVHESTDVAVGDWVGLGEGLIRTVLPRRSAIDGDGRMRRLARRHLRVGDGSRGQRAEYPVSYTHLTLPTILLV